MCIIINHPGTACHPSIEGNFAGTACHPSIEGNFAGTACHPSIEGNFAGTACRSSIEGNVFNKKLKIKKRLCSAVGAGLGEFYYA